MAIRILKVSSSGRYGDSSSRRLTEAVVADLLRQYPDAEVIDRDLAQGVPFVTESLINAMYTPVADRTPAQRQAVSTSDHLTRELLSADYLVLGTPMYNFAVPAVLKAYFDQVARAGVTFRYTQLGAEGLVTSLKEAFVIVTSNGVRLESPSDFTSGYVKHFLAFLGITNVRLLDATAQLAAPTREQEALAALAV